MANSKEKTKKNKNGKFFPIPADKNLLVSFSHPQDEGLAEYQVVSPRQANKKLVPDSVAQRNIKRVQRPAQTPGKPIKAKVNFRKLCRYYAPGSYVCLETLRYLGLVKPETTHITVVARGKLNRKLLVEADCFAPRAARMLLMTGGRAISYPD